MQRQEKVFASLLVLTVLVLSAAAATAPSGGSLGTTVSGLLITQPVHNPTGLSGNLKSFSSYQDLRNFVLRDTNVNGGPFGPNMTLSTSTMSSARFAVPALASGSATSGSSFTSTNIQVQGVDEPDKVKTDGTYLYVASGNNISVILASPPEKSAIVHRFLYAGEVMGLFLSGDRLVVFETGPVASAQLYYDQPVNLMLYDVSHPSAPILLKSISVDGSYLSSRLAGGFVYAIIQQQGTIPMQNGTTTVRLPTLVQDGLSVTLSPSDVFYNPTSAVPNGEYTIILSVRISDGSNSEESILTGWGSTVYASQSNIYVAVNDQVFYPWLGGVAATTTGGTSTTRIAGGLAAGIMMPIARWGSGSNTTIFRVAVNNGTTQVEAEGTVPGTVLNQYSIDEYLGLLRIATSGYSNLPNGTNAQSSNVFVLDSSLKVVGGVRGLGLNENIYAVRFMGETGYVVTYNRIDPLFAISFANPTQPVVQSALKLNGFSDYLHPIKNGYLIGIGKMTTPSEVEKGYVLYEGLKFSLYHVLDNGTSAEVSRYLLGDRGSDSLALSDPHAFVYDSTSGIMALPVSLVQSGSSAAAPPNFGYEVPSFQGAYLFKVSPDSGFHLIGRITQVPTNGTVFSSSNFYIDRIIFVGGYVFTISDSAVFVNALSDLTSVQQIRL